jgi:hypothetical protein
MVSILLLSSILSTDLLEPPACLQEGPPLPEQHGDDGGGGEGRAHPHPARHLLQSQLSPVT